MADPTPLKGRLNDQQRVLFQQIISATENEDSKEKLFLVDGVAGSGKTYLLQAIIEELALRAIPFRAIAYTHANKDLLGRSADTIHSAFVIEPGTALAEVEKNSRDNTYSLCIAKVIIIDQLNYCPNAIFEEINMCLQSLLGNNLKFGGKIVIAAADFRALLPIGTINYPGKSPKESELIQFFSKYTLDQNCRFDRDELFFDYLKAYSEESSEYPLPAACMADSLDDLITHTYGNIINFKDEKLKESGIFVATKKRVDDVRKECVGGVLVDPDIFVVVDTIDKAQCRTYRGKVGIYEPDGIADRRKWYVAISRATSFANLKIYSQPKELKMETN